MPLECERERGEDTGTAPTRTIKRWLQADWTVPAGQVHGLERHSHRGG